MKKAILINAFGSSEWIGGLYYRKNIAFELLQNNYIQENYKVIVYCTKKNKALFKNVHNLHVVSAPSESNAIQKLFKGLYILMFNVKYEFPVYREHIYKRVVSINWIPDFQHRYYPELFTPDENQSREEKYSSYSQTIMPMVLSSNVCLTDYSKFYSPHNSSVRVVPFVSYIEDVVLSLEPQKELDILHKYGIQTKYVVVMNQFWQHKNHIVVFEAMIEFFSRDPNNDLLFVFTGRMEDYRNPEYIKKLEELSANPIVSSHIKILGFIDRIEQVALMKNAAFIIQPSLFEGWGTVVEDAKVLDKTILLSDIPVHREQMNEKCILFDPHDPIALAELIYIESNKEHYDDVNKGIEDMYARAREYSKGFERLLKDVEKKQ